MRPIAEGVWGNEESLSIGPGMRMPVRATVVRLATATPSCTRRSASTTRPLQDREGRAGQAILAPNTVHWLFARAAAERFPSATLFGAPGLEKKLGEFTPLSADGCVADGLRSFVVGRAPRMDEHVFLYGKTLIVTSARSCPSS
jgi:hypothetical protein